MITGVLLFITVCIAAVIILDHDLDLYLTPGVLASLKTVRRTLPGTEQQLGVRIGTLLMFRILKGGSKLAGLNRFPPACDSQIPKLHTIAV